jgi:hypothetical protein
MIDHDHGHGDDHEYGRRRTPPEMDHDPRRRTVDIVILPRGAERIRAAPPDPDPKEQPSSRLQRGLFAMVELVTPAPRIAVDQPAEQLPGVGRGHGVKDVLDAGV